MVFKYHDSKYLAKSRIEFRLLSENSRLEDQRANSDNCTQGNIAVRLACQVRRNFGLVTAGARVAGRSLRKAITVIANHAADFGEQRRSGMMEILTVISENLPVLLQAGRECFRDPQE